ncbi:periodic tryptophan protein 1 [Strigomonas culicis]|uniref:Periodic tryptophan protein 1 n=3 Tax=Strigomonas culicis TaxID=28005 RepID=S9UU28_9TRYP|nr:periodic tryptophan protein 1 [Strigomonas culicis]|eukprot:EPY32388.1 periodic tryptophan protein 1 [Strigomonas culicis]
MLTTFSWVPKGAMRPMPILSTESAEQAREKLYRMNPEYTQQQQEAQAAEGQPGANDSEEEDDTNDALRDIAGGGAGAIVDQVEEEDEEELDDVRFKDTDLVFAVASADPQEPRLEVYTYDEPEDNVFLHHDAGLAAFPLCSAWLTDGAVSMLAIGTMLPFIEVWALDVMDSVSPAIVLGGCAKLEHNYSKKTLRQNLLPHSHTEAVLSVRWNAVAQNIVASGSADHTIKLWDLNQPEQCLGTYREAEKVQSLDWHPTEPNHLLSGGFDGVMLLRDCRAPTQSAQRYSLPDVIEHVEFMPGADLVLASTSSGVVAAFDARQGASAAPLWQLAQPHRQGEVTFNCSRQLPGLLATGGKDGEIALWDARSAGGGAAPQKIVQRAYGTGAVLAVSFHPNAPHILGACGASGQPLVYTLMADVQPVFARQAA